MNKPKKIPMPVLRSIAHRGQVRAANDGHFTSLPVTPGTPEARRFRILARIRSREILESLKWDSLMGCYFFHSHGMFVGIELDGYMHT